MCWYSNGVATGYSWEFCVGGGYRLGHLDAAGQLTGPEASFLYPDLKTGLTGIWSSAEWRRDQLPVSRLPDRSLCTILIS
jgi:hypothetical protein